jgi:hypothetical protein
LKNIYVVSNISSILVLSGLLFVYFEIPQSPTTVPVIPVGINPGSTNPETWQTGEKFTIWRCPRLVSGATGGQNWINLQKNDGDSYITLMDDFSGFPTTIPPTFEQRASVGDLFEFDGYAYSTFPLGSFTGALYFYNFSSSSYYSLGNIGGRTLLVHRISNDEVSNGICRWQFGSTSLMGAYAVYSMNVREKEYLSINSQFKYENNLLYHRLNNVEGWPIAGQSVLYYAYPPYYMSLENISSAGLLAQSTPNNFGYPPKGYVLSVTNTAWNATFASNPRYIVSWCDDVFPSSHVYSGANQTTPFPRMTFSGSSYITFGNQYLNTWSISVWFLIQQYGDNTHICSMLNAWNLTFIPDDNTRVTFETSDGTNIEDVFVSGTISLNTWYHLTVAYDDNTKQYTSWINGTMYVNGTKTYGCQNTNSNLVLGGYNTTGTFKGSMQNFIYYNTMLTNTSVSQIYRTPYSPPTSELTIWCNFLEGSGNIALDSSGNNKDGIITGAVRSYDPFVSDGDMADLNAAPSLYTYIREYLVMDIQNATFEIRTNGSGVFFGTDYKGDTFNYSWTRSDWGVEIINTNKNIRDFSVAIFNGSGSIDYVKVIYPNPYN